jgi:peptidyl-tRNA hydrolase, PTH1 family
MPWLVAGLGNPGERYAKTRHNVGAMVADLVASRADERFRKVRFLPIDLAEIKVDGEQVALAKSHRYMNEAGPSYASLARKRDVEPSRLIAIHDDIDLTFGSLRFKLGGGSGGHNGLRSLGQALGTQDYLRVRIGVGRPPGRQDPADFVLEPFAKREVEEVAVVIEEAADSVASLIRDGLEATQNAFTRPGA